MSGNSFLKKYINSEAAGFAFGLPVAAAYALLLININDPSSMKLVIYFILFITFILVVFIALPYNFYIGIKHGKKIDLLNKNELNNTESTALFISLMKLPFTHAKGIFLRVSGGAVITGLFMRFKLNIPALQALIAVILAIYGAYLAGIVAYIIVINIVRPIAQSMVDDRLIDDKMIARKKFFSFSIIKKIVLFLITPIFFTNISLLLTIIASFQRNLPYPALFLKTIGVVIVNIMSLSTGVLFVIGMINKPLRKLQESLGVFAYSSGNLTEEFKTDLSDDLAYIVYLMNKAITSFREIVKKVKESGFMITESTQELSVSAQEISATSNEQASGIKEIVTTMEDSDRLAKSIADRIHGVTNISMKTKEAVENGFNIIKESLSKMEEIKKTNSESIDGINFLGEKIENIWEIVKIINSIASQTKIIAFNAELEASAAGDAGKNFQIVATEIRRLADNTVTSTNDIKTRINEIQKSSDTLIEKSREGTEKIESGYDLSRSIENLFKNILESSEETFTSSSEIQTSVNQQVDAFEQILKALKQISEGISNFVNSTKLTSKSSNILKEMAEDFNSIVKNFSI